MKIDIVNPNVSNFIKSLRDVGYTIEVAIADILDNSITAKSSEVHLSLLENDNMKFCMLDNGEGMTENELLEAMRLGTKNPEEQRQNQDLGKFGLGLKTASFSQCRKLTVISKKDQKVSIKQWDLDYIAEKNEWALITPEISSFEKIPLIDDFKKQKSGTLVIWENIDSYRKEELTSIIMNLRNHLSLVFHQYLEGSSKHKALTITINNNPLKPFNPFNINHTATQQIASEKIIVNNSSIIIQPFILPHHSKLSQQEYEKYATDKGYTAAQGFYLYRARRLLIYGTWWGLHKSNDAHKLVRIKIDISNDQDMYWGIDIKKSTANPAPEIKNDLKRIIKQVNEKGSRPYTGRSRRIEDKNIISFWDLSPQNENMSFILNQNHPLLKKLTIEISEENLELLRIYLKGVQAYLPLESIQARLQRNPYELYQKQLITETDIKELAEKLKSTDLDPDIIKSLLRTELFKNREELFENGD